MPTKRESYVRRRRRRKTWKKIVGSLACVVVFVTTYMLILPAITMEQTAYCGFEEHKHSDRCYERQLVCGYGAEHMHTETCYQEQQVPVCTLEESAGHLHTEECIQTEQVLACSEEHEHTADCYETAEAYSCGFSQGEGAHTHSAECYETQRVLICTLPEQAADGETHSHTDACYEKVLTCRLEEHAHSLGCYSDPNADVESPAAWERSLSAADVTGTWPNDVVEIAKSQIGYRESAKNYRVAADGTMKGYTRYGAWYGNPYGDWCAMFASFCLHYAGVEGCPLDANCQSWVEKLESPEYNLYRLRDGYTPKPGDLVFFNTDADDEADHVGIVAEYIEMTDETAAQIKTIEGNSANRVSYGTYNLEDSRILGYGCIPDNSGSACELTAVTAEGVCVRLSGPGSSFPYPIEELTITVEAVRNENAEALVDSAISNTALEDGALYLFDVRLWHEGEEIEPCGPVVLSFEGVVSPENDEIAGVFHVDEETATDMEAELDRDGTIVVDTDHFSLYVVVVATEAGGKVAITQTMTAVWNSSTTSVSSLIFTATNSTTDKVLYRVEYSDDGGQTWTTAVTASGTVNKNVTATLDDAAGALESAPIDRIFRVYGRRDDNNIGYTASVSLYDILDSVKAGFTDWLDNSYVQDFGGSALPTTQEELYAAFAVYYALPVLTIESRMQGDTMYVDAQTDIAGAYTYVWEYKADDGSWASLCEDATASINASDIELLLDGGKNIRCKLYEGDQLKASSNTLFVNPLREVYDAAIAEINTGLNLGDLAIYGTQFTDYFFYGNVAKDSRVPFYDAQSYADYLAKLYLDNGGGDAGLTAVQSEWDKYLYDIYDPSYDGGTKSNLNGGYPGSGSTYGDQNLGWPKDSASSFHGNPTPQVDSLNYNFLENGVDYSSFISGLNKTATAVAPGDENTERKYDIDISVDAQAKAKGPVAMILQIQTSWQMFDMAHANALTGEGSTEVGAVAYNTELATLYDIKMALLRFVDYMENNFPGNNLVLGITEVQHAKSQTMFSGTDENGKGLYVSNNYEILRQAIRNWDSFGNCEHVHYDTTALTNAVSNLASNLAHWKDFYGEIIQYDDIQKVAVIIGGPTENSSSTNGYACTLPWSTFQSKGLNSVYSIRTNTGTSNGSGYISWLDYSGNNTGAPFVDGTGTTFTQKYVATTEDAVFNYLVQIAEQSMLRNGIDVKGEDKYVENVGVIDTVTDEFVLDLTEPIIATVYNKDGTIFSQITVAPNDPNLTITENDDGTTTIGYTFGTVYNTKKCSLHFRVQAREDYIGSNNAFTNVGTPGLTYIHQKQDSEGNLTGEVITYPVKCYDTPQVNVPIRFTTVNGESTSLILGQQVDLANLSNAIAKNAEDLVDNYDQISGTLSYTWILPDGTEYDAGSVTVDKGSIADQSFPTRSYDYVGTAVGQYTGTLKVTFTPEAVDTESNNFSNAATAVAVNPLTNPGNVWIHVVSEDSTERFFVKKVWVGNPPGGITSVKFRILANGIAVADETGQQVEYELSQENGWETEISGLPSVKDGVIQKYTVQELDRPAGYLDTYGSENRVEDDYAARVTLSFTPSAKKDNVILMLTYTYNGEERVYTVPEKTTYKNGETYTIVVEGLPLDENGEPYSCQIVSILNANDTDKNGNPKALEVSASSATAEKYLRSSVNTEVKVITNTPAYALPSTGGRGTTLYAAGGLLLILSAGILLLYNFIKRRKENLPVS